MKAKSAKYHIPENPTCDNMQNVIQQLEYRGKFSSKMVEAAVEAFVMNRDSFELADMRDFLRTQFGKMITRIEASNQLDRLLTLKIRHYFDHSAKVRDGFETEIRIELPFKAATLFKRLPKRARRK